MEPDGVGALYQALAELREKQGGLLKGLNNSCLVIPNESRLQVPSGAVIRDIITTVKDGIRLLTGPFPTGPRRAGGG